VAETIAVQQVDNSAVRSGTAFPWRFFVLTFAISWSCWFAAVGVSRRWPGSWSILALNLLGSFGPTLAAFVLVWQEGGRTFLLRLLKRGLPSRIRFGYLLLIAFIPLGVNGAAYWLAGGRHPNFSPVTIVTTFVLYYFLGGSCGEEFGWRAYALDRLQKGWNWLAASLVIGVIWSAWHYPLSLLPGTTQSSTPEWVFFLSTTALAIIMTYIYNRTGANLFGMLLLHTFENITVVMFPPEVVAGVDHAAYYEAWIMAGVAVVLVVADLVRQTSKHQGP